jgi:S1-C subfamily serine protease
LAWPSVGRGITPADDKKEPAVELHQKVARSTAWVKTAQGHGTGWLVDAGKRYLVTARHVVEKAGRGGDVFETADVLFAAFDAAGDVITDRAYYEKNKGQLTVKGAVVYVDTRRDMAVLKLDRVPAGVPVLPLAARNPRPGQEVHVIGNSSVTHGGLFGYNSGRVRNVFRWDPAGDPIVADVVAHQSPTNHGDSGGPVVNNRGEVVAFISLGTTGGLSSSGAARVFRALQEGKTVEDSVFANEQVLDHSIAVSEIRRGLDALKAAAQ